MDHPQFALTTLGRLSLESDGREVQIQKRSLLVLAAIAAARDGRISREGLIDILWTESNPQSARGALRQALFTLRRELASEQAVSGTAELSLDETIISSDIAHLRTAFRAGDWKRVCTLYKGPFLHSVSSRGAPSFQKWIDGIRVETETYYQKALEQTKTKSVGVQDASLPAPQSRTPWAAAVMPFIIACLIALVGVTGIIFTRREKPSVPRVLVLPFVNHTGDSTLNPMGRLTAEWLINGLASTALVRGVDGSALYDAQRPTRAVVSDYEFTLTGEYFARSGRLEFHGRLINSEGTIAAQMEPISVAGDSAPSGVALVSERLLGAVAQRFDDRIRSAVDTARRPPTFAAYQEFARGFSEFIAQKYEDASLHFQNAYSRDTSFVTALLWRSISYDQAAMRRRAVAVLDSVGIRKARLGPIDRHGFDALRNLYAGRRDSAIYYAADAAAYAPNSQWAWIAASQTCADNRPHEGIRLLKKMNPETGWLRDWPQYYGVLANCQHAVGAYRDERETLRRGLAAHPNTRTLPMMELRNLAAMGESGEMFARIRADLKAATPALFPSLPGVMKDLLVHGDPVGADFLYRLVSGWYATHSEAKWRSAWELGIALFRLGRYEEALRSFRTFRSQDRGPSGPAEWGLVGTCAGRLGDRRTALAMLDSLGTVDDFDRRGLASYWQSRVAASIGERERAVKYLIQAQKHGVAKLIDGHTPEWEYPELKGFGPFKAAISPTS